MKPFFRVVLESVTAGNNKEFNIKYNNDDKFIPGKNCYCIVEHVYIEKDEQLDKIVHLFLNLNQSNSFDTMNNNISRYVLSIRPDIVSTVPNVYEVFYNMSNMDNGLMCQLPSNINVSFKYLDKANNTFTNYLDADINSFMVVLRFYELVAPH